MDNEFKDVRDLRDLVKPMLEKAAEPVTIRRRIVKPGPNGPEFVALYERGPNGELILIEGEDTLQQEKERQEILRRRFIEDAQDTCAVPEPPETPEPPEPVPTPAPKPPAPPPVDPFEAQLHEAVAKIGGYRRKQRSINR